MRRSIILAVVMLAATGMPARAERPLYDARVLGAVPDGDRGYIEGIAFDGTDVYSGTAFGSTGTLIPVTSLGVPSRIFSWDRATGAPRAPIVVAGEDTTTEHGIVGLKFDAQGRLYALSNQLGLLRFTRGGDAWQQEQVVELPDVAPCAVSAQPCSPTATDRPPLGNDMTWDADGNLYISDSFQASIWKVTPDGTITQWFASPTIDRTFGANGLRVGPDGTFMAVAITGPDSGTFGPVERASKVIAVPFPDPSAGTIRDLLVLPNGETTDGIAYGASGDLYVLDNAGNKTFVARADGTVDVISNDDLSGAGRMDFPASLVFDGDGALLIANYAWLDGQLPQGSRTVIDVWVNDTGMPEPPPAL